MACHVKHESKYMNDKTFSFYPALQVVVLFCNVSMELYTLFDKKVQLSEKLTFEGGGTLRL